MKTHTLLAYFWLLASAVVLFTLAVLNKETGGDSTEHFFHCKWAFAHPKLFLSHWGKPLYILLGALPAQLGIVALRIFNCTAALATAALAYRYCLHLRLKNAWFAIPVIIFCNIYFYYTPTGNTETFFGFGLMLAAYLLLKKHWHAAAILASFLPYARSEAFFLLPLFALVLIQAKKYKILPWLGLGYVVYGAIGYWFLGDFNWVFTQNPYKNAVGYGSGSWHHFLTNAPKTYGILTTILFIFGVIYALFNLKKPYYAQCLTLMAGSFFAYLFIHSFFWYKGIYGSLGLDRVMVAVVPCMGIMAVVGVQAFNIFNAKWVQMPLMLALLFLVVKDPFHQYNFPLQYGEEEKFAAFASNYLVKNKLDNHKIYYGNAIIPLLLNKDVYSEQSCQAMWALYGQNHKIPSHAIAVWDSHYCRVDAGVPLKMLQNDPNWVAKQNILPKQPFLIIGDVPFEIRIFEYRK